MMEPNRPSVCRNARRNTARKVSAVRMASSEYQGCPPRVIRGSAAHASTASSVNYTVRLPRRRNGAHVLGVCQPCVQVLAAVALMAENQHPAQPCSMTLMAGPVDTRISPTKVNELATGRPLSWFQRHLIDTVPLPYRGAGRRVYPGFMQLLAFMSMNANRHVKAHVQLFELLAA